MVFTQEHELVRQLAHEFAEKELAPIMEEVDKTGVFPQEVFDKMAKAGFFGIKLPRELDGGGGDHRTYAIILEELARVSGVATIYVSSPNSLVSAPLVLVGTDEQKEKYLRPLAKGEINMSFALTEPGAGSDAASIATTAVEDGDYYVLNGRKTFITGAPIADHFIVFAKTEPEKRVAGITSFIVDAKLEGVSLGKPEDKMGMKGCPTSDVVLDNVRVHKSCIIGAKNRGFLTAMKTLSVGRLGVSAQALGLAQGAMDEAVKYSKQRAQFGKSLSNFQAIKFALAEMETMLTACRLMVYEAAYKMDMGTAVDADASMAKLFVTETAKKIIDMSLQIHGGYGYIKEYPIERMYRDIRVTSIYEGTSQVQKMVIAANVLK